MKRRTIAECVGGPADGLQLSPDDKSEPDDWPEALDIECPNGRRAVYRIRSWKPRKRCNRRVYYFDYESPLGD